MACLKSPIGMANECCNLLTPKQLEQSFNMSGAGLMVKKFAGGKDYTYSLESLLNMLSNQ